MHLKLRHFLRFILLGFVVFRLIMKFTCNTIDRLVGRWRCCTQQIALHHRYTWRNSNQSHARANPSFLILLLFVNTKFNWYSSRGVRVDSFIGLDTWRNTFLRNGTCTSCRPTASYDSNMTTVDWDTELQDWRWAPLFEQDHSRRTLHASAASADSLAIQWEPHKSIFHFKQLRVRYVLCVVLARSDTWVHAVSFSNQ